MNNEDSKVLSEEHLTNKITVIVGTRPGIIKMSPIIKELERLQLSHFVIHAGQHYSPNMDNQFFIDLNLKEPKYKLLNVRRYKTHGGQTGAMLIGIEKILLFEKPKIVLVCADANFNLAGALAARKLGLKLGHVEAGLRSYDWRMPEEHNRVMIDHISDYLFTPTQLGKKNLLKEHVRGKVVVTGNTIVDALNYIEQNIKVENFNRRVELEDNYFVFTIHREENVDNNVNLHKIVNILKNLNKLNFQIIFPIHPRTRKRFKQSKLMSKIMKLKNIYIIPPIGFIEFIYLLKNAKIILTDSGGIQEEACILKVPTITLRNNTERPETVKIGSNIITGLSIKKINVAIKKFEQSKKNWKHPFGDGLAAKRIVDTVITNNLIR